MHKKIFKKDFTQLWCSWEKCWTRSDWQGDFSENFNPFMYLFFHSKILINIGMYMYLERTFGKKWKFLNKFSLKKKEKICPVSWQPKVSKGRIFSEKDWYYFQAQTDMLFHYLKLIIWIFPLFLLLISVGLAWKSAAKQKQTKCNSKYSSLS